jgi:hypothetical protein
VSPRRSPGLNAREGAQAVCGAQRHALGRFDARERRLGTPNRRLKGRRIDLEQRLASRNGFAFDKKALPQDPTDLGANLRCAEWRGSSRQH